MPVAPGLKYLNFRENAVADKRIVNLLYKFYRKIENINFNGNPFADEMGDDFKKEVLILMMEKLIFLKRINKNDLVKEDYEEAI